ncbi:MAG: hypothetical protein AAB035_02515 [Nitrospirota bacterium]
MNPLLTLWLMVLTICSVLAGVFYMADHHPDIIGNFWFLLSVFLIGYGLYILINWISTKKNKSEGPL